MVLMSSITTINIPVPYYCSSAGEKWSHSRTTPAGTQTFCKLGRPRTSSVMHDTEDTWLLCVVQRCGCQGQSWQLGRCSAGTEWCSVHSVPHVQWSSWLQCPFHCTNTNTLDVSFTITEYYRTVTVTQSCTTHISLVQRIMTTVHPNIQIPCGSTEQLQSRAWQLLTTTFLTFNVT